MCACVFQATPLIFTPKCLNEWENPSIVRLFPDSCLVSINDAAIYTCRRAIYPTWISDPFSNYLRATTSVGLTKDDSGQYLIFITRSSNSSQNAFGIWADLISTHRGIPLVRYIIRLQRFARAIMQARAKVLAWAMGSPLPDDVMRMIARVVLFRSAH